MAKSQEEKMREEAARAAKWEEGWADAHARQAAEEQVIRTALQRMIDAGCEPAEREIAQAWIACHPKASHDEK